MRIAAGNDLLSQGTQIVGTGDVVLAAGNNLTLETAQSTHSEAHDKKTVKTGLFGSGGIGFTIGKQTVKTEADIADVSHTGTTVGSLEGNVTLVAGNTLAITGSDVMALAASARNAANRANRQGQSARSSGEHAGSGFTCHWQMPRNQMAQKVLRCPWRAGVWR
ncbi:hemagglutinin repeat-containing protein [Xanthomonas sp. 10-10]|uniref:Hemagglutinin repeat-containing protein n=1 Tax=Xanthomonas sp. 10-10 TaxID=3115848 RepID=A0AAU7P8S9_9XANT